MKGFNFPGINQEGNENMADGRSKSSAFQKKGKKYGTSKDAIAATAKAAGMEGSSDKHTKIKRPKGYYKDGVKISKKEYDRLSAIAKQQNVTVVKKK